MAFWRDVFVVSAVKIIALACGALVTVVIVRYLGSAGQGEWAVLTTWAGLAVEVGGLGLGAANVYFASRSVELIPRLAGNSLAAGLGIGSAAAFLVHAGASAFSAHALGSVSPLLLAVALVSVPFGFVTNYFQGLYFATGRIRFYGAVEAVTKAGWLAGTALLLSETKGHDHNALLRLAALFSAVAAASALACLAGFGARLRWRMALDGRLFASTLKYGFRSYLASLLGALLLRSDILLVNFFRGASEVGLYSVAATLANVLFLVPGAVGMLLFPRVAASGDGQGRFTQQVSRSVLLFAVVAGTVAASGAPWVFQLLFTGQAKEALVPFWLLLPGTAAYALQAVYFAYFAGRNLPPVVFIAPAAGLGLNIGLNLLVVPVYGAAGAAVSSSLAYITVLAVLVREFAASTGRPAIRGFWPEKGLSEWIDLAKRMRVDGVRWREKKRQQGKNGF